MQKLRILGCECVFYRAYYQEGSLLFRDIKNKSQLITWKIIPAWSNEANCRQHLLKMQVKLNTYHWGIQWNSMVMEVKKATFQRMGSGGQGRTEDRGDVSRTACTIGSVSYISTVSTSRRVSGPSERRQIRSWWRCRVLFRKRDQYLVLFTPTGSTPLIAADESIQIATAPYLVLYQFRSVGSYAVSAKLHGVTLKDRNLSTDQLPGFHTHSLDQYLHRQTRVVPSELLAPL